MAQAPLYANIANNPNINLDPPPPPLGVPDPQSEPIHIIGLAAAGPADPAAAPPTFAPALGILVNGAVAGTTAPAPAAAVVPPPPPYPGMPFPPFGLGGPWPMGMGMGMGMPFGLPLGMTPQGFPPAPNPGCGVSPLPGFGYTGGMIPPPFAAGGMPWAAGAAATAAGFLPGFGGFFPGGRPPLPFIDGEGGGVGPIPGSQTDPTVRPGGDIPGHTVVQPQETSSIFRILTNCLPWEHAGMQLQIEPMQFDSGWTINRVIKAMRLPHEECQGWGLTKCIELGGGRWAKGMTYVFGSQMATECSLGMLGMGQGANRDGTREKVYVVLHRV
ncbi:uncharacterized protein EI97DRAFT_91272 [Westerdykella ornata]|uniref:Uncharacterized protein n=1 Tax=Westerdykella ornata TaxID=318751 RepID=A0A6A6JGV6_WESOR|nr:uncharacterized protein EI97DRAFT_91272 [Westerdykella ornata]KAF2274866.1 hypothetical protein EI97DRAFT_91272 [Westerdykella ornata]